MTVGSNRTIGRIHDRMPVVIKTEDFERWLDCKTREPREVADLLVPAQEDFFEAVPVSDLVNKVKNTGPEVQAPVGESLVVAKPEKKSSGGGQMSLF
ncbi:hypothetical protein D3C72_2257160 [compost metagenome]